MKHFEAKIDSTLIYTGYHIYLTHDNIRLIDGRTSSRDIIHHPGAVAMLVLTDDDKVLLVEQYRYAAGQSMWEIPAGTLEKDEDPLTAAYRETREETGYTAARMEPVTAFFTSPGFLNEYITVYKATGLTAGQQDLDPDEFIDVRAFSRTEIKEMLQKKQFNDAKTQIALLYWLSEGLI